MALKKSVRSILTLSFIIILFSTTIPTGSAHALSDHFNSASLPSLDAFVEQVRNGQADEIRGIYIPEILVARIVQQPTGMDEFVSPWQNVVTQFGLASKLGSTGLLAHNYLAGERFALLQEGQQFHLIHGDGRISTFIVTEVLQYQALDPTSISSAFMDLGGQGSLTYSDLFTKIYNRPGQVVFQTCINSGDDPAWGRLFIIAEPYSQ